MCKRINLLVPPSVSQGCDSSSYFCGHAAGAARTHAAWCPATLGSGPGKDGHCPMTFSENLLCCRNCAKLWGYPGQLKRWSRGRQGSTQEAHVQSTMPCLAWPRTPWKNKAMGRSAVCWLSLHSPNVGGSGTKFVLLLPHSCAPTTLPS